MKNVLFVSYYFPPAGGPGVQRVTKHVKHLRTLGYDPIVLTVTPEDYVGASELKMPLDASLLGDVPGETEVRRVRSRQPFRLLGLLSKLRLGFLRELCLVPDTAVTWIVPAVVEARRVARERRVDLIYTSVKPHSAAIIGWLLKRMLGKPWVLDFRDPWTQYFLASFPTRLHYRVERALERFLVARADHVVTITPTARENLLSWCDFLEPSRVSCITNGYDEGDFEAGGEGPEHDGVFTILYTGVFCGAPSANGGGRGPAAGKMWRALRRRLSYRPRSFDRLTHSPKFLLDAMRLLFAERPDLRGRVKLVHVGPYSEDNQRYVEELGLAEAVDARGYVRHDDAVRLLKHADALFFCLADSPAGERNDCVPQKVYEYLGARRPVLALAPEGDARDLFRRAGTALLCQPRDLEDIKGALLSLVEGTTRVVPDENFIKTFDRRELSKSLATVFAAAERQHRARAGGEC